MLFLNGKLGRLGIEVGNKESQWDPGVHQEECGQQDE